jgi:hypothetical protein
MMKKIFVSFIFIISFFAPSLCVLDNGYVKVITTLKSWCVIMVITKGYKSLEIGRVFGVID